MARNATYEEHEVNEAIRLVESAKIMQQPSIGFWPDMEGGRSRWISDTPKLKPGSQEGFRKTPGNLQGTANGTRQKVLGMFLLGRSPFRLIFDLSRCWARRTFERDFLNSVNLFLGSLVGHGLLTVFLNTKQNKEIS